MMEKIPRLRNVVFVVLLAVTLRTAVVSAQEVTSVVTVDGWHNGCVPLRNFSGVWTDDWAYSGGDYYRSIGTWTQSVTFPDSIPSDHMVTSVTLQLHGGLNYGTNTISPKLNGTALGTLGPTIITYGSQWAYCPVDNASEYLGWRWDFPTQRNDSGFPGYVSGGTNVFDVGWTTVFNAAQGGVGKLTLEKADLVITHKPLNVFFDVDGDFATHRHDDLPEWTPGSTLGGTSVAPQATPLQLVKIHILTAPRVKGTIEAELVEVSHFPGKAMNYPVASNDISPDMYFDNYSLTKQLTIQSSSTEADSVLTLSVNDYSARAVLKLTIPNGTKTPYVVYKRLPISTSSNMLPDAGWYAGATHINPSSIASATDDSETQPAGPTETGDGYGAFEEYRGFVVKGLHTRLDPSRRDLFVLADTAIDTALFSWLPFDIHLFATGESRAENLARNGVPDALQDTWPEMNPNRDVTGGTAVPVAQAAGQHGLRIIAIQNDLLYPKMFDQNGQSHPAWEFGVLGVAWQRQQTCANWICSAGAARVEPNTVDQGASPTFPSLNGMSFVEIFSRGNYRGNLYIQGASGFATSPPVYLDDAAQTVPDCNTSPATAPNCDYFTLGSQTVHMYIDPLNWFVLHSRLSFPDDFYTKVSSDCAGTNQRLLTSAEFASLAKLVTLHETTHGVGVPHNSNCSTVMFGSTLRMPDVYQFPTAFTPAELADMRTH